MMTATPKNWYSWNFDISDEGRTVATIDTSSWRERADLHVAGASYRVYREHALGDFLLEQHGSVVARAEKPSAWFRSFVIRHDDRHYTLQAASAFSRRFVLVDGTKDVGTIAPAHPGTRRAEVDLPGSLPIALRVFMVWLALLLWRRDAS